MTCPKCDNGKTVENLQPGPEIRLQTGGSIQHTGGFITHLCECRKSLPPRHGKAQWWSCETIEGGTLDLNLGEVVVTFSREVPISEDNYLVHRTEENCCYRVTADVQIDLGPVGTSATLREVAAFLLKMADKCDELDAPHPSDKENG